MNNAGLHAIAPAQPGRLFKRFFCEGKVVIINNLVSNVALFELAAYNQVAHFTQIMCVNVKEVDK